MKPRMHFDDVAWEKSEKVGDSWLDSLYDPETYNSVGVFLAEHHHPREWSDFKLYRIGGFNLSFLMTFTDTENGGAILRFPLVGVHMFPEEKGRNEVSIMDFIREKSMNVIPIPIPRVLRWGKREESPSKLGPFIMMSYTEHERSMSDVLETPGRQPNERPELNPDVGISKLRASYIELANIVLSLSTISMDKIGSLEHKGKSTWEVAYRPLSFSMHEIVRLGTLPRSELPNVTFNRASIYFETLANLQISHLEHQRNDAFDSADDCRRKFVARFLFRKIVRDRKLRDQWISYENGPFPVWCDDFRPQNVVVDKADRVVGALDWEFTYTAPVEFSHAPPWWLLLEKPEYWSKGLATWCEEYEARLEVFLEAMADCEENAFKTGKIARPEESQRLSSQMRRSWDSGDFWIMYAARNNFAFDIIYWNKIDQRFFGSAADDDIGDVWKKRLDLLEPEERKSMKKYVNMKLQECETRPLLWDPGHYNLEYMCKIND